MKRALAALLVLLLVMPPAALAGGSNAYQQTNLVSDMAGVAAHTDAQLVNPWGIAFFPGAPFWVADNNAGVSTLYDANGNKQALVVAIPTASGGAGGTPTGIVTNSTGKFGGYVFIFDTEDGAIVGWKSGTAGVGTATRASAVYKGLAMITNAGAHFCWRRISTAVRWTFTMEISSRLRWPGTSPIRRCRPGMLRSGSTSSGEMSTLLMPSRMLRSMIR
jgi:hypothetical protein